MRRLKDANREKKPCAVRLLPCEVEVRDEARHEDEIERAVARHLVGNPDVAAVGVVSLGLHAPDPLIVILPEEARQPQWPIFEARQ
jgi:hypothetical protein